MFIVPLKNLITANNIRHPSGSDNSDERLFIASYVVCSIKSDLLHTTLA